MLLSLFSNKRKKFIWQDFTKYLQDHIITCQLAIAWTPQHKWVLKRKNQIILKKVSIMLIKNKIPLFLWNMATYIIIQLTNCNPIQANNDMLLNYLFYGTKPYVNLLKIFGCLCFIRKDNI